MLQVHFSLEASRKDWKRVFCGLVVDPSWISSHCQEIQNWEIQRGQSLRAYSVIIYHGQTRTTSLDTPS